MLRAEFSDFSGMKIVVSGYYGFDNLGDELILQTLIQYAGSRGCEITVLSQNPQRTTEQYGVPAIKRTNLSDIWNVFAQSHLFISGGGGLFQDSTGPASPIYYGGLILLADYLRLPVIVWGQGVGPINHPLSKAMTRWAFSKPRKILVRDEKSENLLLNLFKESQPDLPLQITADPVWLWQADGLSKNSEAMPTGIRLGVSLREWPSLSDKGIEALAKAMIFWIQRAQTQTPDLPVEVMLMSFQETQDVPTLKKLETAFYRLFDENENRFSLSRVAPQEVLQVLPSLNFMVAMRFHALLLGLTQNRFPLFAIAYDPKVKALAEQCDVQYALPEDLDELPSNAFETFFTDFSERDSNCFYPAVVEQIAKAQANLEALDAILADIQTDLLI